MDDEDIGVLDYISRVINMSRSDVLRIMIKAMIKLLSPDTRFIDIIRPLPEILGRGDSSE